jgi:hypothetical protein
MRLTPDKQGSAQKNIHEADVANPDIRAVSRTPLCCIHENCAFRRSERQRAAAHLDIMM